SAAATTRGDVALSAGIGESPRGRSGQTGRCREAGLLGANTPKTRSSEGPHLLRQETPRVPVATGIRPHVRRTWLDPPESVVDCGEVVPTSAAGRFPAPP